MMREFMFEEEVHQSLACVPMVVRRKLDRVGVKIGLKQWQALGRGDRLAISHLPIDHENERETLKLSIAEAVERACGEQPRRLPKASARSQNRRTRCRWRSRRQRAPRAWAWSRRRESAWMQASATR